MAHQFVNHGFDKQEEIGVEPLKVALLGCGVVGTEVARLLTRDVDELSRRAGAPIELIGIGVRRLGRGRGLDLPAELFTTDVARLVKDADIVVEVIGGIEPARTLILQAMAGGAGVVTANKALLAEDGPTLYDAAREHGVDLYYEAAVAGAIPLLRPLRESLAGDRVRRVLGIVNGTTNYVLDKMDTLGLGFAEAVAQAQELGYAEADPTADVEGFDAAAKAAILASLAFHTRVKAADVHREGITAVTAADVAGARAMGSVVKLLAICERTDTPDGEVVSVRVHPAMIPASHPLASVREAYNAVFVEAEAAGELMFYGRGAGGVPTASAVLGDLVTLARNRVDRRPRPGRVGPRRPARRGDGAGAHPLPHQPRRRRPAGSAGPGGRGVRPARRLDRDGAPAAARRHPRGGRSRRRRPEGAGSRASLVVVTHTAPDAALAATVEDLAGLDSVEAVASVMRVEGD